MRRVLAIAGTVWLEMIRKKDIYVLLVLLITLLFSLLSLNIFGLGEVVGYVKDIGLLFTWLFAWILAVVTAARELPEEEKRGTVYALLAKPISRFEVVLGKWLGAWSIVAAATLVFYAAIVLVVRMRESTFSGELLVQGYLLHLGALAIISSVAIALSTRMNLDAAATFTFAVTGGSFLILPRVPDLMTHEKGIRETALAALYYILPHFELFDMRQRLVHEDTAVDWLLILQVLLYAAVMTGVFIMLAWISYRNKRFSRGTTL